MTHNSEEDRRLEVSLPHDVTIEQLMAIEGIVKAFGGQVIDPEQSETPNSSDRKPLRPLKIPGKQLVLVDEAIAPDLMMPDIDIRRTTAVSEMYLAASNLTERYAHLFNDKIPTTEGNYRTPILRRPLEGSTRMATWELAPIHKGDHDFTYRYFLVANQGRKENTMQSVAMEMLTQREVNRKFHPNKGILPTVKLEFEQNEITTVSLAWSNNAATALRELTKGTALGKVLAGLAPVVPPNQERIYSDITFMKFDIARATLALEQQIKAENKDKFTTSYELEGEFRINTTGEDTLAWVESGANRYEEVLNELSITPISQLTKADYLELLESCLALIPVAALDRREA